MKRYWYYVEYGDHLGKFRTTTLAELYAYIAYCLSAGHKIGAVYREARSESP